MKYTYDIYKNGVRTETTTDWDSACLLIRDHIIATDNETNDMWTLKSEDQIADWELKLDRQIWGPRQRDLDTKYIATSVKESEYAWDPMADLLEDSPPSEGGSNPFSHQLKEHQERIKKAVDPSHYKNYIDEYQWLDAMQRIPTLREPAVFVGALELQVRKYLDRNGQKDDSIQELRKAMFYLLYMIEFLEGKAPSAKEIHDKIPK